MSSGVTISGIPASSGRSAGSQAAAVREVAPATSGTAAVDEGYGYGSSAPGSYQPVSGVSSAGRSRADARPKPAENKPSVETAEKETLPEAPAAAAVESSSSRGSGSSASSVLAAPRNSTGAFPPGRSPCPETTLLSQRTLKFRWETRSSRSSHVSANLSWFSRASAARTTPRSTCSAPRTDYGLPSSR